MSLPGRVVVVTGTGTGVGKTVTVAALAVRAATSGSVVAVKPVQTGVGPGSDGPGSDGPGSDGPGWAETGDADEVHRLAGCTVQEFTALPDPLAPETAARLGGVRLPPVAEYADRVQVLARFSDTVLVEGAGGLLVRLDTAGGTLLDLIAALPPDLPTDVVVVVSAGLGTLNHTELTVGRLRAAGVEPAGLVIGSWPTDPGLAERCNADDLPRLTGLPLLARLPAGAGRLAGAQFRRRAPGWFT